MSDVPWASGALSAGRLDPPAGEQPGGDHGHGEDQVQPVVGGVKRHEVGAAAHPDAEPVDPQHGVHDATHDQVGPGGAVRAGQNQPDHPVQQVHEVVEYRHWNRPSSIAPDMCPAKDMLL